MWIAIQEKHKKNPQYERLLFRDLASAKTNWKKILFLSYFIAILKSNFKAVRS